jgi:hypothetical protein
MHPSWWLGVAAAGAVLAGTLYAGCRGLAPAGPSESERLERLEADRNHAVHRREVIRDLTTGLIEGRLTLRQAAVACQAENEVGPRQIDLHVEYQAGRTDEERYCRALLGHVRAMLVKDARAPAVLARLEAELTALVRSQPTHPASRRGGPLGRPLPRPGTHDIR